ncbi:unnamed protein product [Effrenium voratum]|nr:unnamed protein product [Effrenium voratum]
MRRFFCCFAQKSGSSLAKVKPEPKVEEDATEGQEQKPVRESEEEADPGVAEADASNLALLDFPRGDLEIFEQLGRGASGCRVHRCKDGDGRIMAAKVLPLTATTWPDMIEDFEKEVQVLKLIGQHPGLVEFFGAWRLEGAAALGIELCGSTLEQHVRRRAAQPAPFAAAELAALAPVAGGLAHLHGRGVLHRDLKAANVFLASESGGEGESVESVDLPLTAFAAKLGDFGAAKVCSRAQTPVQTPHFMAPEVAQGGEYNSAADVWGLGCLIFEVLEMGLPYGEDLTLPQLEKALVAGLGPQLTDRPQVAARCPDAVCELRRAGRWQ